MNTSITVLGAAFAFLAGCSACAADTNTPSCCVHTATVAPTGLADKSLFQVESKWTTDAGKLIKLGELEGRPQVVAMFFAHCQYACPIIVNDMKRIEASLMPELRARVRFTLVSFDTKRDTPAALAAYRGTHALSADNWTLLHGEPDDVLELAALLGVKFKEDANGQFSHSNVITVLNSQGEIVLQQVGLSQDIRETVRLLQTLAPK
ncbi:MAG TPA: SCO family protein [Verrucomicrobiae bacterium]